MVRRPAMTAPRVLACAVAILALAARADAQSLLDFVTFDDVDYIRWAEGQVASRRRRSRYRVRHCRVLVHR
jgi:hypothetical protein